MPPVPREIFPFFRKSTGANQRIKSTVIQLIHHIYQALKGKLQHVVENREVSDAEGGTAQAPRNAGKRFPEGRKERRGIKIATPLLRSWQLPGRN